jgi:hypothetical protein
MKTLAHPCTDRVRDAPSGAGKAETCPRGDGSNMSTRRNFLMVLLLAAVFCSGLPTLLVPFDNTSGAAWAKKGGSSDDDDDDDDDNSGSGSGSSGSGSSNSGSGSNNSGSGSNNSGSGNSGSGSGGGNSGSGSSSGGSGNSGSGNGGSGNGSSGSGGGKTSGSRGGSSDDVNAVSGRDVVALQYSDGRIERISSGMYEVLGRDGRVITRHRATRNEERRLKSLGALGARKKRAAGVESYVQVNTGRNSARVEDSGGWTQILDAGRYVILDPNGNTVTRRSATKADVARIRQLLGLQ